MTFTLSCCTFINLIANSHWMIFSLGYASALFGSIIMLGCKVVTATDGWTRPSVSSDKALIRPLRKYLNIFKHILENIQKICQLRPIANGHNQPSVRPSVTSLYNKFTPPSVIYDNPTWMLWHNRQGKLQ